MMSLSEDVEIQFIFPARSDDPLSDMLVEITKAIDERDPELLAHGFLGGEHGYGAHWDSPVFTMRPFYWSDCDCGRDEREEAFTSVNEHATDCYQTELHNREKAWEERNNWAAVEKAAFGNRDGFFGGFDEQTDSPMPGVTVSMWTPRKDPAMDLWRALYDKKRTFERGLYQRLGKKYGLDPHYGAAVHCTCGYRERWIAYIDENGHRDTCAVILPNFRHHATGFEVRWYKYIGRDNETVNQPADLTPIFRDCMTDIASGILTEGGDAKQAPGESLSSPTPQGDAQKRSQ